MNPSTFANIIQKKEEAIAKLYNENILLKEQLKDRNNRIEVLEKILMVPPLEKERDIYSPRDTPDGNTIIK